MNIEDPTTLAADLVERIHDEVSSADQDWRMIERWARELAELAAETVRRAAGPGTSPPDP